MKNDSRMTRSGRERGRRGQALAEMGVVITLLVFLVMGIIEFGRVMMIANMITQAARDGARIAAVVHRSERIPNECGISDISAIQNHVRNQIAQVTDASGFTINVAAVDVGGIPLQEVTITGTINYIFQIIPGVTSLDVVRTAAFRDEDCA
jgi:Flp pilus assembly protein TadG